MAKMAKEQCFICTHVHWGHCDPGVRDPESSRLTAAYHGGAVTEQGDVSGGPGLYGAGPLLGGPIAPAPMSPFASVLAEMKVMHDRKNADYGRTGDPLANVRASTDFGVPAWVGAMIRANDKMRRIQKFAAEGALANESVEDSLLDLAVYAVIGLILYRETAARG